MRHSSIEWLYLQSANKKLDLFDLLEAKAKHKEEIVEACNLQRNDYRGMPTYNKSGEEYYQETYGGNNE